MNVSLVTRGARVVLVLFSFIAIASSIKLFVIHNDPKIAIFNSRLKVDDVYPVAARGDILADKGELLAVTTTEYDLTVDLKGGGLIANKELFYDNLDSLSYCLSTIKGAPSKSSIKKRLKNNFGKATNLRLFPRNLSYSEYHRIKEFPMLNGHIYSGGLRVKEIVKRIYPLDLDITRTIGRLNTSEKSENPDGEYGLELSYNSYLKGQDGFSKKLRVSNERGNRYIEIPVKEPQIGSSLHTTLDVQIQDILETSLQKQAELSGAEWASAVVLEVETGDIKAIANYKNSSRGYRESVNYAVGYLGLIEPGSTFKGVTALAALETGKIDTADHVQVGNGVCYIAPGMPIKDSHHYVGNDNKLTFKEVFITSSNVGTIKYAKEIFGNDVDSYFEYIKRWRLDDTIPLNIVGLGKSKFPDPDSKYWNQTSLASLAFGYNSNLTPLHIATFYNGIANGGKMMEPRLVSKITDRDGKEINFPVSVRVESMASEDNISKLQDMMLEVVENPKGTGHRAVFNDRFKIAGKTGTAKVANPGHGYHIGHHGSFVGYIPADNPRYTIYVVVSNKNRRNFYGGTYAGPVFKTVADMLYVYDYKHMGEKEGDIPVVSENIIDAVKEYQIPEYEKGVVPDLIGLSASDAIYVAESCGYEVRIKGSGVAISQRPKAGLKIERGVVNINLK